jgi:hypothetical protein
LTTKTALTLLVLRRNISVRPSARDCFGGTWKQTSYNGSIRKNYAGVGYTFDAERDAFIPPKPYNSWLLNEDTCLWEAPVAMPADAGTGEPPKRYTWDEATTSWVESE